MNLAPITIFVYNRPNHTRQTIEALQNNEFAALSDLFIYSDGSKGSADADMVQSVRDYIRSIDGFRAVTIIEREENYGLSQSIICGVTEIVNRFGRIIVLEDDLIVSQYFLKYMNNALELYQDEARVMHISGFNFNIDSEGLRETFFFRSTSCWGWATWELSWKYFEKDIDQLYNTFNSQDKYKFDIDGTLSMWKQVVANKHGKIDTWAIFWYASVFKQNGLCLHPIKSLVKNIGFDGSGEHCSHSSAFDNYELPKQPILYFERRIEENPIVIERFKKLELAAKRSFITRIISKLCKIYSDLKWRQFMRHLRNL